MIYFSRTDGQRGLYTTDGRMADGWADGRTGRTMGRTDGRKGGRLTDGRADRHFSLQEDGWRRQSGFKGKHTDAELSQMDMQALDQAWTDARDIDDKQYIALIESHTSRRLFSIVD